MNSSPSIDTLKQKIIISLNNLPPEGLEEIAFFLDYIQYKFQNISLPSVPYQPIALGGLWKDEKISDEDIDEIRKKMWQSLEKEEL